MYRRRREDESTGKRGGAQPPFRGCTGSKGGTNSAFSAFDRLSGTFIYRNRRANKKGVFAKRSHPGNWHNRRQQRELNEK
jgi:hypothetical protein